MVLRWKVAPYTYVESLEHRLVAGGWAVGAVLGEPVERVTNRREVRVAVDDQPAELTVRQVTHRPWCQSPGFPPREACAGCGVTVHRTAIYPEVGS